MKDLKPGEEEELIEMKVPMGGSFLIYNGANMKTRLRKPKVWTGRLIHQPLLSTLIGTTKLCPRIERCGCHLRTEKQEIAWREMSWMVL